MRYPGDGAASRHASDRTRSGAAPGRVRNSSLRGRGGPGGVAGPVGGVVRLDATRGVVGPSVGGCWGQGAAAPGPGVRTGRPVRHDRGCSCSCIGGKIVTLRSSPSRNSLLVCARRIGEYTHQRTGWMWRRSGVGVHRRSGVGVHRRSGVGVHRAGGSGVGRGQSGSVQVR